MAAIVTPPAAAASSHPIIGVASCKRMKGYCPNCVCDSCVSNSLVLPSSEFFDEPTSNLQIRANLDMLSDDLDRIAQRMTRFSDALYALIQYEPKLLESYACQRSLRPPTLFLPIEILIEIFLLCLPSSDSDDAAAPLIISHVCRTWRHISLSTPSLWSTMDVRAAFSRAKPAMINLFMMRNIWVPRSGGAPLNIAIEIRPETAMTAHLFRLPYALSGTYQQLRRLSLVVSNVRQLSVIPLEPISLSLPLLESLRICSASTPSSDEEWTCGLFERAERLRAVTLENLPLRPFRSLPWQNVRELECNVYSPITHFHVQQLCPKMHTLSVAAPCASGGFPERAAGDAQAPHTCITSIELRGCQRSLSFILSTLNVPHLERLTLFGCAGHGGLDTPLADMLLRSTCALRALALRWTLNDLGPILQCLESLPSLEELTVAQHKDHGGVGILLARLTRPTDAYAPPLLPNLRSLSIDCSHFEQDNLVAMVQSRICGNVSSRTTDTRLEGPCASARLRHLRVRGPQLRKVEALARIWELKGLRVELRLRHGTDVQ